MKEEEKLSSEKKIKKLKKETILLLSIIIMIILIDQVSKIIIQKIGQVNLVEGILNLEIIQNKKAAYGIESNSTIMYVVSNVIILGIICKFITTQNQFVDRKLKIFLSFIVAGGSSNVIDRLLRGYVTEFIHFTAFTNLPVFNLADIFVLVGWIAIAAIFASFTIKEWRSKEREKILKDESKKE